MCKVLQQALGVVDGGMQLNVRVLPLAIQIFSTQRATMTRAEMEAEIRSGGERSNIRSSQHFVQLSGNKAETDVRVQL